MCKRPVRNRDHALQANDRGLRIDPYGLGSSKCVSWREARRRGATRARECGERAARAQGVVMGRRDARMDGEDAGRRIPSQPAGRTGGASEVDVVGQGLVELEVGNGVGLGEV